MKQYKFNLATRPFGRVGSVLEFYQLIGFNFNGKDVRNLRINPNSAKELQYIMIRTQRNYIYFLENYPSIFDNRLIVKLKRSHAFRQKYGETQARFDFFNYSPQDDAALPRGVMVEYEPGDEMYVEPRKPY